MSVGGVGSRSQAMNDLGAEETPAPKNQKVLNAAQMYEAQFLRQMLTEMRKTVPESEFLPEGPGERMYKAQLDDQYVDTWVEKGGIGLQDLIYDQLMEKFYQKPVPKPQGPLPFQKGTEIFQKGTGIEMKRGPTSGGIQYQIRNPSGGPMEVQAPWSGHIEVASTGGNGENTLRVRHGDGRVSLLNFNGVSDVKVGQKVEAGQRVGTWGSSGEAVLSWAAIGS